MFDLFTKLIEQCKNLLERQEKQDEKFYLNFVAPTFADFEIVHKDYINSFIKYNNLISTESTEFNSKHPIFEAVKQDISSSKEIRSKIYAINSFRSNSTMQDFTNAIFDYMIYSWSMSLDWTNTTDKILQESYHEDKSLWLDTNHPRFYIVKSIEIIVKSPNYSQKFKKRLILGIIERAINQLKENYQKVIIEHIQLKHRLLTPK